jgi:hypothetical protein
MDAWWRAPGAKLGTCIVLSLLVLAVPVWIAWFGWFVVGKGLGFFSVIGNALWPWLTALVMFVGTVGLIGDIPSHHKVVTLAIQVVTVLASLTFWMLF